MVGISGARPARSTSKPMVDQMVVTAVTETLSKVGDLLIASDVAPPSPVNPSPASMPSTASDTQTGLDQSRSHLSDRHGNCWISIGVITKQ